MPESWKFSPSGGGELSPGNASTGFSSNQAVVGNSSGQLVSSTNIQVSGSTLIVGGSTGAAIGFFGTAGSTKPEAYTTAAITSGRVFPTTASISTFTGSVGAGASFTSRADLEALVQVVAQIYEDLRSLGILR